MQWKFQTAPVEFRALRRRQTKDGNAFFIIVVEDDEGYQNEISCRNEQQFPTLHRLRKGDYYTFPVTVIATQQWQFTRLDSFENGGIQHLDESTGESEDL